MKTRTFILVALFLLALFAYPVARFVARLPADMRGRDAIAYVTLNGNVQSMEEVPPGELIQPHDVTGVFLFEGSTNQRMIQMLRQLPNLERITIGPKNYFSADAPVSALSEVADSDQLLLQQAFPNLTVVVSGPTD